MGRETMISDLFVPYDKARIAELTVRRKGETKLGEQVQSANERAIEEVITGSDARFVLLGIPEDIGVRANGGIGGAHTAWLPALKALLNVQSTDSFNGKELLVLGAFDFSGWMDGTLDSPPEVLQNFVAWIDDAVFPLIQWIVTAGKIPVVIGGGHNNAYPLLKGSSMALGKAINCINLDAHSDYRVLEGRHSGNGFRYARVEGFLHRYAMVGLHRNYNSQAVINTLEADAELSCSYFDDWLLQHTAAFPTAVAAAIAHTQGQPTGIELDMDCIAGVLSSAVTPSGITVNDARRYVQWCAAGAQPAYLHVTEGAVQLRDGRSDPVTPKLIAYLVSDFIRSCLQRD